MLCNQMRLNLFAMKHVPLLAACRPRIVTLNKETCSIAIRNNWVTGNHTGNMYMGALNIGADAAGGFLAFEHKFAFEREHPEVRITPVFKQVTSKFLKPGKGDVIFTCNNGDLIGNMLENNISEDVITVTATTATTKDEPVAVFDMLLHFNIINPPSSTP